MQDEARIVELEIRFMEQQRLLEELSEVVLTQGRQLDRLQTELLALRRRLEAAPDPTLPS